MKSKHDWPTVILTGLMLAAAVILFTLTDQTGPGGILIAAAVGLQTVRSRNVVDPVTGKRAPSTPPLNDVPRGES